MQRSKRTALALHNALTRLIGCLVLLTLMHPVQAGLSVGNNIALSTQSSFENAPATAVNADSGQFLAVWTRNEPDPATPEVPIHKIIARRVGNDGAPLGTEFLVSGSQPGVPGGGSNPAVAFDTLGKVFMVVYQRTDTGSANQGIFAQRVDPGGQLIADEISVATTAIAGLILSHPVIAFNADDNEYLVVWENSTGGLTGQRVSAAGTPASVPFIVSQQSLGEHNPAIVYNPTAKEFVVAYDAADLSSNTYVLAQRLSRTGNLLGLPIQISTSLAKQSRPTIAFDSIANRYAVVWQDERNAAQTGPNAYARIVNIDGTLAGSGALPLADHALAPNLAYYPAENRFLVTWIVQNAGAQNNGFLLGRLLKADLTAQTRGFPISQLGKVTTAPALAIDPLTTRSKSIALWPRSVGENGSDIFAQVLDLSFEFTDLTLTATAPKTLPANGLLTYKFVIKNTGNLAAEGVKLTDTLPAGTVYQSDNAGCIHKAGVAICNLNRIDAGKSVGITLIVNPSNALGVVENKAELDWDNRITLLSETTAVSKTRLSFAGSLQLVAPNGGERLNTGSTQPIAWEVSNQPPGLNLNYKLSLSLNNGKSWSSIAQNLTGQSYDWTPLSSKNSKLCRIRVQGFTDTKVSIGTDRSDAPFTLEVLRLDFPNGGEALPNDLPHSFAWTTHATREDVANTRVRYSLDSGQSWKHIALLNGNPGSYLWSPPVLAKNAGKALIEVRLFDRQGKSLGSDRSDRPFTLEAVKLLAPNGGETLQANSVHTITWSTHKTPSPISGFKLFFSDNGGKRWKLIAVESGNPGTYAWNVTPRSKPSSHCLVKLVLLNEQGKAVGSDLSDDEFTVVP